jgi:hypothetical protein
MYGRNFNTIAGSYLALYQGQQWCEFEKRDGSHHHRRPFGKLCLHLVILRAVFWPEEPVLSAVEGISWLFQSPMPLSGFLSTKAFVCQASAVPGRTISSPALAHSFRLTGFHLR